MYLLQRLDSECLQQVLLVDRHGRPGAYLAQKVLFERHLGEVHPLALLEPVDVARRNLRQRDEGGAGVAEVGEADGIPGRFRIGAFAGDLGGTLPGLTSGAVTGVAVPVHVRRRMIVLQISICRPDGKACCNDE